MEEVVPESEMVGGAVEGLYRPSHSAVPLSDTVIHDVLGRRLAISLSISGWPRP